MFHLFFLGLFVFEVKLILISIFYFLFIFIFYFYDLFLNPSYFCISLLVLPWRGHNGGEGQMQKDWKWGGDWSTGCEIPKESIEKSLEASRLGR